MVVENQKAAESGQSVVEFLLVLPLMLAITMLLIRVNTVIQISIVDQRYARQQTMFISGNAADYPLRANMVSTFAAAGDNRVIIGVCDVHPGADGGENSTVPASTWNIGRKNPMPGASDNPGEEPTNRANIRVRDTVTLCLPPLSVGGKPILNTSSGGVPVYTLPNDPRGWDFCSSKQEQII